MWRYMHFLVIRVSGLGDLPVVGTVGVRPAGHLVDAPWTQEAVTPLLQGGGGLCLSSSCQHSHWLFNFH